MARNWNGSSDKFYVSAGNAGGITGAITIAWLCRFTGRDGASWHSIYAPRTSAPAIDGYSVEKTGTNADKIEFQINGAAATALSTTTTTSTDSWCLHVITKASGTVTPRYHRYKYSTNVWVHEAFNTTLANPTITANDIEIGGDYSGSGDWFMGDMAAVGVWASNLAAVKDEDVEALAYTFTAWIAKGPSGLWLFDQSATGQKVQDISGGGANESSITGTSVSTASVPVFNISDGVWIPTLVAAAGGNVTVNAVPGVLTLGAVAPTPSIGLTAPAGGLTLGAVAPTVAEAMTAPAGQLTLGAAAASLSIGTDQTAPAGALTLGGTPPTVLTGTFISAPAGGLTLSAASPTIQEDLPAPPGVLTLNATAPVLQELLSAPPGILTLAGTSGTTITGATESGATLFLRMMTRYGL